MKGACRWISCSTTQPARHHLHDTTTQQLADIEISPFSLALHWPQLDVDFSVGGLVAGVFGTAKDLDAQRRGA